MIRRPALQFRYIPVRRVYVPLGKTANNAAGFVDRHIPHVHQWKRQCLCLLSVLVLFLKVLRYRLAKTLPAVCTLIFRKVMPPFNHHYLIVQFVLMCLRAGQYQRSSAFGALLISMFLVFRDFLILKPLQLRLRMSGLSAALLPCLFPRVRDNFLLMQWCLAGRYAAVCPVLLCYPMQPGYFFLQCLNLRLSFFIPPLQFRYQCQRPFFFFPLHLVYLLHPRNLIVLLCV